MLEVLPIAELNRTIAGALFDFRFRIWPEVVAPSTPAITSGVDHLYSASLVSKETFPTSVPLIVKGQSFGAVLGATTSTKQRLVEVVCPSSLSRPRIMLVLFPSQFYGSATM